MAQRIDLRRQLDQPPAPPADPDAYRQIVWPGYRATMRVHVAWPLTRHVWRTLCGQLLTGVLPATDEPVCTVCTRRFAKIVGQYDADHRQSSPPGV